MYDRIRKITANAFEGITENVYEAVMVISQRARQINARQHEIIEEQRQEYLDTLNNSVMLLESEAEFVAPKFPKPTNIAVEELLEGKLTFHYGEEETEEQQEDAEA
jgi:DNA-directed RNA polymerase subunit K/omega